MADLLRFCSRVISKLCRFARRRQTLLGERTRGG